MKSSADEPRASRRRPFPGLPAAALGFLLATLAPFGCGRTVYRPPKGATPIERTLEVTAYCDCGACCNWKRNWYGRPVIASGPNRGAPKQVGITASGTRTRHGTIAADPRKYPFGTIMHVPGYGYGRVEDSGSSITGDKIDLWFPSHSSALEWGRRKLTVKIWLPRK